MITHYTVKNSYYTLNAFIKLIPNNEIFHCMTR